MDMKTYTRDATTRNATSGVFERITSSIGNKFSQLANIVASIKNSTETFFVGSEAKRQQNINKICGELILRISTKIKDDEYEILDAKKLNNIGRISAKLTHKILTNEVAELVCLIKNELLNQADNFLSITEGHPDKSVNIMLATLYQVDQQVDEDIKSNTNFGYGSLLKLQISEVINNKFIIQNNNPMMKKHDMITLLKDINKRYQEEIELLKKNASDKINSKL